MTVEQMIVFLRSVEQLCRDARNQISAATKIGKSVIPPTTPDWKAASELLGDAETDLKKVTAAVDTHCIGNVDMAKPLVVLTACHAEVRIDHRGGLTTWIVVSNTLILARCESPESAQAACEAFNAIPAQLQRAGHNVHPPGGAR